MDGISDGPGGMVQGPSGAFSGGGFGGQADVKPTGVVGPPDDGFGRDPTVRGVKPVTEEVGHGSDDRRPDATLTWEQRALRLLSGLLTAKGFTDLPLELRDEALALIGEAPDDARS